MRLPSRLGALRERNFRLFFIGQVTSQLGTGMVGVALSFAVLDLTGSVSDLGLVLAAQTVPLVVFLLVGGTVADRLPRRAVMLVSDSARCVTQGTLAALLISGGTLWLGAAIGTVSTLVIVSLPSIRQLEARPAVARPDPVAPV